MGPSQPTPRPGTSSKAHPTSASAESELALCASSLWDKFQARAQSAPKLNYLSVDTSEACDLDCEGCYYHPEIDRSRRSFSSDALLTVIDDAYRVLSTRTLVFAGKEPLLSPGKIWEVLESARTLERSELSTGIVTNGRSVRRYWDDLAHLAQRNRLSFLDVSFDSGIPSEHDRIRGQLGTFQLAFDALKAAAQAFPAVRVGTSCVLRGGNAEGLLKLIARTSDLRVSHWITPFLPPPFSGLEPPSSSAIVAFVRKLRRLLQTDLAASSVDLTLSLPGIYVAGCLEAGLFDLSDLREDKQNLLFVDRTVGQSRLSFHCAIVPDGAWHHGRVLSDGSYLPHVHYLQTANPYQRAVGRIQDSSIVDLYQRSIAPGSLFHQSVESRKLHNCRTRSCWNGCFGGWSLADDAKCRNQELTEQPWMCKKTWNTPAGEHQ